MKVSVAIPCYNAERYIGETIESILAQSRPADEIIIADDRSTDGSRDVIARYPQVKLVVQERNAGCAASRNLAIRTSTGDVIAIVDADDVWDRDHLAATTGLLEQFPDAGFAFSAIRRFGLESEDRPVAVAERTPLQLLDGLLGGNFIPQPTVVFRRALYDTCGGFDASMRYCEDYDLWLRFAARAPGLYTGQITAGYRIHPTQLNHHYPEMFAATWHARLKLLLGTAAGDAESVQRRLAEVWRDGLYSAWAFRSRESLDFMLTLSDHFPSEHAAATRWRRRARLWPVLSAADRLRQVLPGPLQRALRPGWSGPAGVRPRI
jgi:hypothetical protein